MVLSSLFWLSFNFGIHIVLVNIVLGLSIIVPLLKYIGSKKKDKDMLDLSRKLMRWIAITYGIGGVFGTAFTVFLFSYYPLFIFSAGDLTVDIFGIAIFFIILNFFSITAYWYGWDHWSERTHNIIGILLAGSAIMIPFGFRGIFAFLNEPTGLEFANGHPYINEVLAYSNPTFWPLFFKTIDGALITAMLATIAGFGVAYLRNKENRIYFQKSLQYFLFPSFIGLLIMIPLGFWYLESLANIPYKFNSIMEGLGWTIGNADPALNMSWLFVLSLIFTTIQILSILFILYKGTKGELVTKGTAASSLLAGIFAAGTVEAMEQLNAFSQFPRFIAALGSQQISRLPAPWNKVLLTGLSLESYNHLAAALYAQIFTSIMMGIMIVVLIVFIYIIFFKHKK
ncbi:MAG: cytochrome ubiquinol oxidase subunit I [Caldisphaeraceae archaeon]|nr:cytochrome ubiquinol oxidase subunit I [Caldisphaeraceae archaeon]